MTRGEKLRAEQARVEEQVRREEWAFLRLRWRAVPAGLHAARLPFHTGWFFAGELLR